MANLIILEGLSRTGKSTISKALSDRYGYKNISIKDKMPDYVDHLPDLYHGMHISANSFFSAFKDETFVLDRSFLSELVYSRYFERKSYITQGETINDLLFDNNFILVYFSNRYKNYVERVPKDKIVYNEDQFCRQKDLFEWYFDSHKTHFEDKLWNERFIRISSSENSIEQSIELIENKINQYFPETIKTVI
jgi:thymidylate kinase